MNTDYKFFNGKIEYTVLIFAGDERYNVALLERDTYCPYVVAINVRPEANGNYSWAFGHYFENYDNALAEFREQQRKL